MASPEQIVWEFGVAIAFGIGLMVNVVVANGRQFSAVGVGLRTA